MQVHEILVTTDFSTNARAAYPTAAELARLFDARIHLIHVIEPLPPHCYLSTPARPIDTPDDGTSTGIEDKLDEIAAGAVFEGLRVVTAVPYHAHPHEAIRAYIAEHAIDLVVAATRGRTGLSHMLIGSFAEKLLRYSPVPVLAVHGPAKDGLRLRRVLVPYDFSVNAEAVLPVVRLLTDQFRPQFTFLYVHEPDYILPDPFSGVPVDGAPGDSVLALSRAGSHFDMLRESRLCGIDAEFDARCGRPSAEIPRIARDMKADLILMATHGRTGVQHFLIGSVAEKVTRHATCCVLTVRPQNVRAGDGSPRKCATEKA